MKITFFYVLLAAAYCLGSFSSAVFFCKIKGFPDPRKHGSGNAGATNVLRIAGKSAALCVLLLDTLKGFIAVSIAKLCGMDGLAAALILFATVIGHILPIFYGFKGGKGVATALGGFLGLSPILALSALIIWLVVAVITRYSSLSSIMAITSAPAMNEFFGNSHYFLGLLLIAILIVVKHWSNIERLLDGSEPKIGKKLSTLDE
ncbi:MAG: glycerol-3-phosphate 1-O-acyltransferase PlsY [Legionellales bacterium]|nr:glycerol-3-phosphate 1-O-acyltransferase PlsY [Legionellales bacterium]